MSTRTLSRRDARAKAAIEAVLGASLPTRPTGIHVTAQENHSGEPALYVYVDLPSAQDMPTEPEHNRLVVRMIEALEGIDDARFPYLNFGARRLDEAGLKSMGSSDETN